MLLTTLVEAGRQLPWPTRVLKTISDFLLQHGWALSMIGVVGMLIAVAAFRTERVGRMWHRFVLTIPVVGPMARKQAIARVAFVMSTLLRSGVVYLTALEFAAKTIRNSVIRDALIRSGTRVSAGQEIGKALADSQVVPPMVVQLFSVGQQSGQLAEMLDRLATTYDSQVASSSARLSALLEPTLIVVLAVLVGFILFATFLPILEAGNVS
jgi:type II secretory pathway component PulF